MAHIAKRTIGKGIRYEVRWRGANGREKSRSFLRKLDAEAWKAKADSERWGGEVPTEQSRLTLREWSGQWLAADAHRLAPTTSEHYESSMRNWILPAIGDHQLRKIAPSTLRSWMQGMLDAGASPSVASAARRCLHRCLEVAVAAELISRNPCTKAVVAPRIEVEMTAPLTPVQLLTLEAAMPNRWRSLVLVGGTSGPRLAELAAVTRSDVLEDGRMISITKTLHAVRGGGWEYRTPKTAAGRRVVALPPVTQIALLGHLASLRGDVVWPGLLSNGNRWRKNVWAPAISSIGRPELRFHDLRHTAISLAIGAGADAKVVQHMAGHASLAMTLGRYGHMLGRSATSVAAAMDTMFPSAEVAKKATRRTKNAARSPTSLSTLSLLLHQARCEVARLHSAGPSGPR